MLLVLDYCFSSYLCQSILVSEGETWKYLCIELSFTRTILISDKFFGIGCLRADIIRELSISYLNIHPLQNLNLYWTPKYCKRFTFWNDKFRAYNPTRILVMKSRKVKIENVVFMMD